MRPLRLYKVCWYQSKLVACPRLVSCIATDPRGGYPKREAHANRCFFSAPVGFLIFRLLRCRSITLNVRANVRVQLYSY